MTIPFLTRKNSNDQDSLKVFKLRPDISKDAKQVTSKVVAKERLKNNLMQEHIELPDQMVELMRADLIKSFKKYLNVSEEEFELSWVRKKEADIRRDYLEVTARIPVIEK